MEWKPIESAPRDGTAIDLWVRSFEVGAGGKIAVKDVGRWCDAKWGRTWHGADNVGREVEWVYYSAPYYEPVECGDYRATHWMPLPQPPAQDA